jgi:hypothetical protein
MIQAKAVQKKLKLHLKVLAASQKVHLANLANSKFN